MTENGKRPTKMMTAVYRQRSWTLHSWNSGFVLRTNINKAACGHSPRAFAGVLNADVCCIERGSLENSCIACPRLWRPLPFNGDLATRGKLCCQPPAVGPFHP